MSDEAAPHEVEAPAPIKATILVEPVDESSVPVFHVKARESAENGGTRKSSATSLCPPSSSLLSENSQEAMPNEAPLQLEHAELEFEFGHYEGEVSSQTGLRHGKGALYYVSGNVYDGDWKDGAADGIGEKVYANGDLYRGGWRCGKRHGRGGYLFQQGDYFEGIYVDDMPNGYGILSTVQGDRYAGQWRNGKKEGKGRETLENGQIFSGMWKDGKKQGRGKLLLPGTTRYIVGIWNNNAFFRELNEHEIAQEEQRERHNAEMDDDDADDRIEAEHIAPARSPPIASSAAENIELWADQLAERWTSGIDSMEKRLQALDAAFGRIMEGDPRQDGEE